MTPPTSVAESTQNSKLESRASVRPEGLRDQLCVHVLTVLPDQFVLESKDPAVVVVVPATIIELVVSCVFDHHELAVTVDVVHLNARRRAEGLARSSEQCVHHELLALERPGPLT